MSSARMSDRMSKYHVLDLISRIGEALDPNIEIKREMFKTTFSLFFSL
jgi:hypothetical protein